MKDLLALIMNNGAILWQIGEEILKIIHTNIGVSIKTNLILIHAFITEWPLIIEKLECLVKEGIETVDGAQSCLNDTIVYLGKDH